MSHLIVEAPGVILVVHLQHVLLGSTPGFTVSFLRNKLEAVGVPCDRLVSAQDDNDVLVAFPASREAAKEAGRHLGEMCIFTMDLVDVDVAVRLDRLGYRPAKRTGPRTVEVVYEGLITSGNHDNVDLRCAGCGETPCIRDNRGCCPNRPDEEQTT
jgi:hypothetical protein